MSANNSSSSSRRSRKKGKAPAADGDRVPLGAKGKAPACDHGRQPSPKNKRNQGRGEKRVRKQHRPRSALKAAAIHRAATDLFSQLGALHDVNRENHFEDRRGSSSKAPRLDGDEAFIAAGIPMPDLGESGIELINAHDVPPGHLCPGDPAYPEQHSDEEQVCERDRYGNAIAVNCNTTPEQLATIRRINPDFEFEQQARHPCPNPVSMMSYHCARLRLLRSLGNDPRIVVVDTDPVDWELWNVHVINPTGCTRDAFRRNVGSTCACDDPRLCGRCAGADVYIFDQSLYYYTPEQMYHWLIRPAVNSGSDVPRIFSIHHVYQGLRGGHYPVPGLRPEIRWRRDLDMITEWTSVRATTKRHSAMDWLSHGHHELEAGTLVWRVYHQASTLETIEFTFVPAGRVVIDEQVVEPLDDTYYGDIDVRGLHTYGSVHHANETGVIKLNTTETWSAYRAGPFTYWWLGTTKPAAIPDSVLWELAAYIQLRPRNATNYASVVNQAKHLMSKTNLTPEEKAKALPTTVRLAYVITLRDEIQQLNAVGLQSDRLQHVNELIADPVANTKWARRVRFASRCIKAAKYCAENYPRSTTVVAAAALTVLAVATGYTLTAKRFIVGLIQAAVAVPVAQYNLWMTPKILTKLHSTTTFVGAALSAARYARYPTYGPLGNFLGFYPATARAAFKARIDMSPKSPRVVYARYARAHPRSWVAFRYRAQRYHLACFATARFIGTLADAAHHGPLSTLRRFVQYLVANLAFHPASYYDLIANTVTPTYLTKPTYCAGPTPIDPERLRPNAQCREPDDIVCKETFGPYLVGVGFRDYQPLVSRTCTHNELKAVLTRGIANRPDCDEQWWIETLELSVAAPWFDPAPLEPTPLDEWMARYPTPVADRFRRTLASTNWAQLDYQKIAMHSAFVKRECVVKEKYGAIHAYDPRLIQACTPESNIILGPYAHAHSLRMKTEYTRGYGLVHYGCGMTGEDLDAWLMGVEEVLGPNLAYVCLDAKRFDASVRPPAHQFLRKWFAKIGYSEPAMRLLETHDWCAGYTHSGVKYGVDGTVASGVSTTTLGNSMLLKATIMRANHQSDQWRAIVMGDDVAAVSHRDYLPTFLANTRAAYTAAGFEPTFSASYDRIDMEFCSGRWWTAPVGYEIDGRPCGHMYGPKPGRLLPKLFWAIDKTKFGADTQAYVRAVCQGMHHNVQHLPYVKEFLDHHMALIGHGPVATVQTTRQVSREKGMPYDHGVYDDYRKLYGLLPSQVAGAIRRLNANTKLPALIVEPIIESMIERDAPVDTPDEWRDQDLKRHLLRPASMLPTLITWPLVEEMARSAIGWPVTAFLGLFEGYTYRTLINPLVHLGLHFISKRCGFIPAAACHIAYNAWVMWLNGRPANVSLAIRERGGSERFVVHPPVPTKDYTTPSSNVGSERFVVHPTTWPMARAATVEKRAAKQLNKATKKLVKAVPANNREKAKKSAKKFRKAVKNLISPASSLGALKSASNGYLHSLLRPFDYHGTKIPDQQVTVSTTCVTQDRFVVTVGASGAWGFQYRISPPYFYTSFMAAYVPEIGQTIAQNGVYTISDPDTCTPNSLFTPDSTAAEMSAAEIMYSTYSMCRPVSAEVRATYIGATLSDSGLMFASSMTALDAVRMFGDNAGQADWDVDILMSREGTQIAPVNTCRSMRCIYLPRDPSFFQYNPMVQATYEPVVGEDVNPSGVIDDILTNLSPPNCYAYMTVGGIGIEPGDNIIVNVCVNWECIPVLNTFSPGAAPSPSDTYALDHAMNVASQLPSAFTAAPSVLNAVPHPFTTGHDPHQVVVPQRQLLRSIAGTVAATDDVSVERKQEAPKPSATSGMGLLDTVLTYGQKFLKNIMPTGESPAALEAGTELDAPIIEEVAEVAPLLLA